MTNEILNLVLNSKNVQTCIETYKGYGLGVNFGEITEVYVIGLDKQNFKNGGGAELIFCFDNLHTTDENGEYLEPKEFSLPIGYKTPKGYFSTKMIPVNVTNTQSLTEAEVIELLQFYTDAKRNSFDPFWHENEANRRNVSAWNYIAQNFITDPYCTR